MLMLSVMSLSWAGLIGFIYNIKHQCLAHGSAQPLSRFFLAHSRGDISCATVMMFVLFCLGIFSRT